MVIALLSVVCAHESSVVHTFHAEGEYQGEGMFFMSHRFLRDRADAGVQLARKLGHYRNMRDEAVVLGLPRGGVVIGYYVARELRLPLDIIVSRKIGCPGHEEYAVGALAQVGRSRLHEVDIRLNERWWPFLEQDGSVELERDALRMLSLSEEQLQPTIEKERQEAQRRLREYRGDRPPLDLEGKIAILVDDGIATGSTAKAALRMLNKSTLLHSSTQCVMHILMSSFYTKAKRRGWCSRCL